MFRVFIENQHVKAPIGWFEEERNSRVDLWISVFTDIKTTHIYDELNLTLDYTTLVKIVITESSKEKKLLETLASDIAQAIYDAFPAIILQTEVVIRKKKLPVAGFDADAAGIVLLMKY